MSDKPHRFLNVNARTLSPPHPTLSEAMKDAALVALGRAIDVPNRKPDPRPQC